MLRHFLATVGFAIIVLLAYALGGWSGPTSAPVATPTAPFTTPLSQSDLRALEGGVAADRELLTSLATTVSVHATEQTGDDLKTWAAGQQLRDASMAGSH